MNLFDQKIIYEIPSSSIAALPLRSDPSWIWSILLQCISSYFYHLTHLTTFFDLCPSSRCFFQTLAWIKILISATLPFTSPATWAFTFPNNAASYLLVNIVFSNKYVYRSIWTSSWLKTSNKCSYFYKKCTLKLFGYFIPILFRSSSILF